MNTLRLLQDYNVKKILVPLDGSQNAFRGLDKAIYIARQCKATITGICIVYSPPQLVFDNVREINDTTRNKINNFMDNAKIISAKNGIDFTEEIILGNPKKDILDYADKWNYDMIVIGSRGAGSSEDSYLGSVTNHILQKSSIPVLVVK